MKFSFNYWWFSTKCFFSSRFLSVLSLIKGEPRKDGRPLHSISFLLGALKRGWRDREGWRLKLINKMMCLDEVGHAVFYFFGILRVWLYHPLESRRHEAWIKSPWLSLRRSEIVLKSPSSKMSYSRSDWEIYQCFFWWLNLESHLEKHCLKSPT